LDPYEKVALHALASGWSAKDPSAVYRLTQKGYVLDGRPFSSLLSDFLLTKGAEVEALAAELRGVRTSPPGRGIWLDRAAGEVWIDGERIPPLTKLEHRLLQCLYENEHGICDKHTIVDAVWSGDYIEHVDDSRIAKLVSRLRDRIEPDPATPRYVVTVHGRGYKLVSAGVE